MKLPGRNGLWIGAAIVGLIFAISLAAPWLAPHDPTVQIIGDRLTPPAWSAAGSVEFPLGTDALGRDIFSRLLYAARLSIMIGLVTAVVSSIVGTAIGILAGYFGGPVSTFLMRLVDVQTAFPFLVIAVAVVAVMGPSPAVIMLTLAVWTWVPFARVAHANTLKTRKAAYVEQSLISGAGTRRVLSRHILPNVLPSALVIWAFAVSQVIVAESALSFLGLGIQPPTATLGGMISDGRNYMGIADWIWIVPGLAIVAVTLGVNLIGDGLRDRLEPGEGSGGPEQPTGPETG